MNRNRIALFRPSSKTRTASSDYADALIPELAKLVDLRIFEEAPKRFDPDEFAAVVYLTGNTGADVWIYEVALGHPGIVVLNGPDLHHVVREMTKDAPEAYFREVFYEIFGQEWDAARDGGLDVSGQQPGTFSMLRRLLDRSVACIVDSRYLEGAVRMKGFRGRIARIPSGTFVRKIDGGDIRKRFGIEPEQPLIGVFGDWWKNEQLYEYAGAFRILDGQIPGARMLVAEPGTAAERGMEDKVHIVNPQSPVELDDFMAACDVVLNVEWPPSSECSALALRAFGLGKTVVIADFGIAREWPDDVCVKIPDGLYRDQVLFEGLKWLLLNPQVTAEIGSSASRWASERTWGGTARLFADFLATYSDPVPDEPLSDDALRNYLKRWVEPATDRESYLKGHERRLIRTLQLTPAGNASDRILEMGCYLQVTPALRNILGYGNVRGCYFGAGGRGDLKLVNARDGEFFECAIDLFDCESDPFPYPDGYFATVLCCELLEHLKHDPMWMMSEINRVLRPGGTLLLTTPNVVSLRAVRAVVQGVHPGFYNRYPDPQSDRANNSKHEREYTAGEISQLLGAAGFAVDHIETGPYALTSDPDQEASARRAANLLESLQQPLSLRGDCVLALGRKETLPKDLRPFWLYDSATPGAEPR